MGNEQIIAEERFQGLFNNSPDAIFIEDGNGQVLEVNPAACRLHGMAREGLVGKNVLELVPPDKRQEVVIKFQKLLEGEWDHVEGFSWTADGRAIPVEIRVNPIEYSGKLALLLHVRDITARKLVEAELQRMYEQLEERVRERTAEIERYNQALQKEIAERQRVEDALRQSEERYRAFYEDNPSMYFTVDTAGQVLSVNRFGAEQLGYTVAELVSQPVLTVFHEEDRPLVLQQLQNCSQNPTQICHWKLRKIRKNGTLMWVEEHARAVYDHDGRKIILVVCEDITEQKQAEQMLHENEKFAVTGRMAARIAHEINNPLAAIKNSIRLVSRAIPSDHPHYHYVHKIDKEVDRIAGIVHQVLELYRPDKNIATAFRVDEFIHDVIDLMSLVSQQVDVQIELDGNQATGMVRLPQNHLRQILYNLIQNAIEASPPGGVVRIAAAIEQQRLKIAVIDQGGGISEDARLHLFEPFYTTKYDTTKGGIGLGLPICKSLVEAMNGAIDFESNSSVGTEFRLMIPCG